jgi:hypothetical protein
MNATGTMDHVLDYQVIELKLCVRISVRATLTVFINNSSLNI